jgi:hypothetical protein
LRNKAASHGAKGLGGILVEMLAWLLSLSAIVAPAVLFGTLTVVVLLSVTLDTDAPVAAFRVVDQTTDHVEFFWCQRPLRGWVAWLSAENMTQNSQERELNYTNQQEADTEVKQERLPPGTNRGGQDDAKDPGCSDAGTDRRPLRRAIAFSVAAQGEHRNAPFVYGPVPLTHDPGEGPISASADRLTEWWIRLSSDRRTTCCYEAFRHKVEAPLAT